MQRKAGRPKLPESERKSIFIGFKVSTELWKKVPREKKRNKSAYMASLIESDVKELVEQRNDTRTQEEVN